MANKYYDPSGYPQTGAPGSSAAMRSELATIATGFEGVEQDIDDALTGASGAVTTATAQAGIATTQAGISTTQAGIATTQAGISTTQAGIATTQAGIAADKAAEAAATKLAVDATYDEFDDRYLGRKASDPTTDNDGGALQEGTLYFNTTTKTFKGYNGTAWINLPATTAANLTFSPAGSVSATDVQAAIEELDTEKLSAGAGAVGETNLADAAIPSKVHLSSSKTTPVDADEIPLIDSAASFGLKHLTWANLKATLETYFDGLYLLAKALASEVITGTDDAKYTTPKAVKESALIQQGTVVTTTGFAAYDFSIPASVISFKLKAWDLSTNGSSAFMLQLGTGGSPTTSGYQGNSSGPTGFAAGFRGQTISSTGTYTIFADFELVSGNTYLCKFMIARQDAVETPTYGCGKVTLSGSLDLLRLTTVGGTDTLDSINANTSWGF